MKYEWFSDLFGKIEKLKLLWADNKTYPSDTANTETLLRIIQSIPSPRAEPFKQRLASLGNQRVEEINDPELWMQGARARAIEVYQFTLLIWFSGKGLFFLVYFLQKNLFWVYLHQTFYFLL
jgi:hypothetical protein